MCLFVGRICLSCCWSAKLRPGKCSCCWWLDPGGRTAVAVGVTLYSCVYVHENGGVACYARLYSMLMVTNNLHLTSALHVGTTLGLFSPCR